MPFDPKLYDVGDVVRMADNRPPLRLKVAGTTVLYECLYLVSDDGQEYQLGRLNDPPLLVRPAKWRVGDRIHTTYNYKEGPIEAEGIVRNKVNPNRALLYMYADDGIRWPIPEDTSLSQLRLVHRPGVQLYTPDAPQARTVPCTDCKATGVYVGFTMSGPCPTCNGTKIVPCSDSP